MRVVRLVPNTPLWQKAAGYARRCPWVAGPHLAQLMEEGAQAYAKAQGFRRVYIPSGMVGLYEKYGYHKVDELVNYGGGRDAVFAKELTEERENR